MPIFEEDTCALRDLLGRDKYGTDVVIAGFKKLDSWKEDIEKAVISNFFVLAYLLMELLERSSRLNEGLLRRYSRRAGPALGGLLGIVPQCGISGAAATLFSTGSITVGTMLAVFFATSDEMLPIFLSSLTENSGISWKTIVLITLSKAALGILLGYLADLLFGRWFRAQKSIHSFCEREHCDCDEEEGSVFLAALRDFALRRR